MESIPLIEKEINTYKIKIYPDNDPQNPRKERDNLSHIVCFHKKYTLGDKQSKYISGNYDNWSSMEKEIKNQENVLMILPLYLYDHSDITISLIPWGCHWDGGQVGFIYVTKGDVFREFKVKRITKKIRDKVSDILKSEVKIYNRYLTGDIYGYVIEDSSGNVIDSCWGYFEDPQHIIEEMEKEIINNYDYQLPLGV